MSDTPPVVPDRYLSFRSDREEGEFSSGRIDPFLYYILAKAARFWWEKNKCPMLITSIWRHPDEDKALKASGIHTLWRAVDVHADGWDDKRCAIVSDWVNYQFQYDPTRPELRVALWEPHGTGPHLHFQTHPATIWRKV